MNQKRNKNKKGFTMIELIIVVAVLGILSTLLIPSFVEISRKAKLTTDISTAKTLQRTLDVYNVQPGVTVICNGALESVETALKAENLLGSSIVLQTQGTLEIVDGAVKLNLEHAEESIKEMAAKLPQGDSQRDWITGIVFKVKS